MGANEPDLQRRPLVWLDIAVGQGAEAGRQSVHGLLAAHERPGQGV